MTKKQRIKNITILALGGLSFCGVSLISITINCSGPSGTVSETNPTYGETPVVVEHVKETDKTITPYTESPAVSQISFSDYIGEWATSTSYIARSLYCTLYIKDVNELEQKITLAYKYDLAPALYGDHIISNYKTIELKYKQKEVTVYPPHSQGTILTNALTTELFDIIDDSDEPQSLATFKLAATADGNLYINYSSSDNYGTQCEKID